MASFPRPPGMGETGIFTPGVGGCGAELKRFQALQGCNKRAADQEMKRGALLVGLARKGDVDRLHLAVRSGPRPWFWFSCQMFKEAAVNGQVKILKYMLVHGIQLDRPPLDECLCTLCEACDDTDGGASVVAAARYLVTQGGADVNKVRRRDWRGPLHICSVRNLHELGAFLVDAGADVNAVAKDDSTPLGLCSEGALMDVLKARGARTTWRRDAEPTPVPPPVKKRTAPLVTAGAATSSTVVEDGHVRPERKLTAKTTKEISAEVARELASLEIDEGFRFDTGMGPDDLVPAIRFGPVDKS
jgi:hypothetical protein